MDWSYVLPAAALVVLAVALGLVLRTLLRMRQVEGQSIERLCSTVDSLQGTIKELAHEHTKSADRVLAAANNIAYQQVVANERQKGNTKPKEKRYYARREV